jgi:hypothetical protein
MRPSIWVSKSMEKLAATLTATGHPISADTVRKELVKLGFSRQSNRKAEDPWGVLPALAFFAGAWRPGDKSFGF